MSGSRDVLISLVGVAKVFDTDEVETHALSDVHLEISAGEYVCISGPSGSGKTTLLSVLGLLDSPTRGTYRFDGTSVETLSEDALAHLRNRKVGFVFQSFNLIGDLTVAQNVELPLTLQGVAPADRQRRVDAALERVGMLHRKHHAPAQLSGGQQQRVAVARAIAIEPLVLFADEPTGNLDSKNGDVVMDLLRDLHAQGTTICIVTHNEDYAQHAHRTIHLLDGHIVDEHDEPRRAAS